MLVETADRLERNLGELALAIKTMQPMLIDKGFCTADELNRSVPEQKRARHENLAFSTLK